MAKINELESVETTVLYCEDTTKGYFDKEFSRRINWDSPMLEGYNYVLLKNSWLSWLGGFFRYSNTEIVNYLNSSRCDVLVVHGWNYFTSVFAILYAKWKGIPIWLRAENPLNQEILKPWYVKDLKRMILQNGLFRLVDRFLYIGQENKKFYLHYGVPEHKLDFWPYAVDNEALNRAFPEFTKKKAREELQLPEGFMILFCGKLIAKKNPWDLIKAFQKADLKGSILVLVGEGELRVPIHEYISNAGIKNILLPGFVNQSRLPLYYKAADVFVLPSGAGETWGLVVNEAMNFSLPIIVSNLAGCSADLVRSGENGHVYECGNILQLTDFLSRVYRDKAWLEKAGSRSSDLIKEYRYQVIIDQLAKMVEGSPGIESQSLESGRSKGDQQQS